jgi:predicted nucleic acid-binding protein
VALVVRKLKERAVSVLQGSATLDLARYELGNIIWKECSLERTITPEEAEGRVADLAKILKSMEIARIETGEDLRGVMQLATRTRASFYDASYLYAAKRGRLILVTEDSELQAKARHGGIRALKVAEALKVRGRSA